MLIEAKSRSTAQSFSTKVINLNTKEVKEAVNFDKPSADTPKYREILKQYKSLIQKSAYRPQFDYSIYKALEERFLKEPPRGGITFNSAFKLVNSHPSCEECLYSFMIDTYGRGCTHNCAYCYARSELIVHGYWNNPFPMPININEVWQMFYTIFETDRKSKWRPILEKRIPLRIGYASDSFMWMDVKYQVTQELLRILKHYNYPYIVATRSDLVAKSPYIDLMDKDLCSIQMSIISLNDTVNKKLEPGSPSAQRRLDALKVLNDAGFWTTVRLNPLFPIHADGFYTDPKLPKDKKELKLDVFNWDMVPRIAETGVPSLIGGFGRFSSYALNQMDAALGTNLREFYRGKKFEKTRDFHYSDAEIRYYYERLKAQCKQHGIEFTTCYIGNGEPFFWKDQDLWDNKKDCCNAKGKVCSFKNDSQEIPYADRLKFSTSTCGKKLLSQRDQIDVKDFIPEGHDQDNPFLQR